MPRAGTAERKRLRAGLPGVVKPGRVSWVHGTKLAFFQAHKDEYLAASEVKKTTAFYDNMVHLFTAKYGWSLDWNEDLEEDQEIADDADPDEDVNSLSTEETEQRAVFVKQLRKKIASWYQAQYGQSRRRGKEKISFREIFNQPALDPPAPIKPRVLHFYTRKFYHERIKARVEARWQAVSRLEKPPAMITVRNAVIKHCWLNETPEFRAEVEEAREKEFEAAKEAYKVASSGDTPTSPEQYNIALNNAGYYLQPFADAAHERYGMNVVILLCGPVPEHGGRIEVRSVHAGTTNGIVPKTWAEFDRAGFDAAQRSMVEFAHRCFTPEECRARGLDTDATSGQTTAATVLPTTVPPPPALPSDDDRQPEAGGIPPFNGDGGIPPFNGDGGIPPFDGEFDFDLDLDLIIPPAGTGNAGQKDAVEETFAEALDQVLASLTPEERHALENMPNLTQDEADALLAGVCNPAAWQYMRNTRTATVEMGRALMEELVALPDEERALYERRLVGLSMTELHEENTAADERRVLRRMAEGMGVEEAAAASEVGGEGDDDDDAANNEDREDSPTPRRTDGVSPPSTTPPPPPLTNEEAPPPPPLSAVPPVPPPPARRLPAGPPHPPQESTTSPPPPPPPPPPAVAKVSSSRPKPRPTHAGVTTNAEAAAKGVEGAWGGEPTAAWSTELRRAVSGFARGREWGGECWENGVQAVIALERAWEFPEKGVVTMPTGRERPDEIEAWMKRARKWDVPFELKSTVGPKTAGGSFSERWWGWWGVAQPAGRIGATGDWGTIEDVGEDAWDEMALMHGRNGLLMFAAGLLWWGEAAAKDEGNVEGLLVDWRLAVEDFTGVLAAVLKRVPALKAAYERSEDGKGWAKTKGTKRKGGADKENESTAPAKKRR